MTHPISTLHLQEDLSQLKSSQLISLVSEPTVTKFQGITAHSLKQNSKDTICPKCFWRGSKIIKDISVINSSTIKRQTGFQDSAAVNENCILLGYYTAGSGNSFIDISGQLMGTIFKDP